MAFSSNDDDGAPAPRGGPRPAARSLLQREEPENRPWVRWEARIDLGGQKASTLSPHTQREWPHPEPARAQRRVIDVAGDWLQTPGRGVVGGRRRLALRIVGEIHERGGKSGGMILKGRYHRERRRRSCPLGCLHRLRSPPGHGRGPGVRGIVRDEVHRLHDRTPASRSSKRASTISESAVALPVTQRRRPTRVGTTRASEDRTFEPSAHSAGRETRGEASGSTRGA